MNLRTIKAKELCNGYIWSKRGVTVYYSGGIYILSCFDYSNGYETLKELKEGIKTYFKNC